MIEVRFEQVSKQWEHTLFSGLMALNLPAVLWNANLAQFSLTVFSYTGNAAFPTLFNVVTSHSKKPVQLLVIRANTSFWKVKQKS